MTEQSRKRRASSILQPIQDIYDRNDWLEKQNKKLEKQLNDSQAETKQAVETIEIFKGKNQYLSNELENQDEEITDLEINCAHQLIMVEALQNTEREQDKNYGCLERKWKSESAEKQKLESRVKSLEKSIEQYKNFVKALRELQIETRALEDTVQTRNNTIRELKCTVELRRKTIDELEETLSDRNSKISSLTGINSTLRGKVDMSQVETNRQLQEKLDFLSQELATAITHNTEQERSHAAVLKQNNAQLTTMQSANHGLKTASSTTF